MFENGVFRIVGRTSVDIIKSGGHKISALDIEQQLLDHPGIAEVCLQATSLLVSIILSPNNAKNMCTVVIYLVFKL